MNFTSFLLFPFAILYGFVVFVRNLMFDIGILKSKTYPVPVISIGNLNMGGTGKTPHIEYLIRLLKKENFQLATLSRGYGRKTKGFVLADDTACSEIIGDEPTQYFKKFNDITVAVSENRCLGIEKIIKENPKINAILLDDAFQHRYVKAGISILLTDYFSPFYRDFIFPSGKLREQRKNAKRADFIIVTKCPKVLSPLTQKSVVDSIRKYTDKQIFFSYIDYGELVPLNNTFNSPLKLDKYTILLFTGIANPYPLEEYLSGKCSKIDIIRFKDHYQYKEEDVIRISNEYRKILSKNKIIITTEKDAMRIKDTKLINFFVDLPLFYIPIEIKFHCEANDEFDNQIINYVRINQPNSIIH
jgi:tetraacyldisaccharide 4'-kinase